VVGVVVVVGMVVVERAEGEVIRKRRKGREGREEKKRRLSKSHCEHGDCQIHLQNNLNRSLPLINGGTFGQDTRSSTE